MNIPLETIEAIDNLAGRLTKSDVKAVKKFINEGQPVEGEEKLSSYQRFHLRGEDIYLYMLGKYNSKTRARVLASMCTGFEILPADLKQWAEENPAFKSRVEAAKDVFKDMIREELVHRAVIGEDKPVFDKDGNHLYDVKVKSDRLLEKMLSANCEEYKEKTPSALLGAGGITFNVVNFASEQTAADAVRLAQEHSSSGKE